MDTGHWRTSGDGARRRRSCGLPSTRGAKPASVEAAKDAAVTEPAADTSITLPSLRSLLTQGWSSDEAWGVWSAGTSSSLRYRVSPTTVGRTTVILRGNPFLAGPKQALRIRATVNGVQALDTRVTAAQAMPLALRIPVTTRQPGEVVHIVLNYEIPVSPAQIGMSADQRLLAFGLTSFEICKSNCGR